MVKKFIEIGGEWFADALWPAAPPERKHKPSCTGKTYRGTVAMILSCTCYIPEFVVEETKDGTKESINFPEEAV